MTAAVTLALTLLSAFSSELDDLGEARGLIRQGLLQPAQERLLELGVLPDPSAESSRILLLGNIDFERGDPADHHAFRRCRGRPGFVLHQ